MNTAAFDAILAAIPYAPTTSEARGILAPVMRATGHILFLLAVTASTPQGGTPLVTDAEALDELRAAQAHLTASCFPLGAGTLSDEADRILRAFRTSVNAAADSWTEWTGDEQVANLRNLSNRAAAIGALFDREYAGLDLTNSDPGTSL